MVNQVTSRSAVLTTPPLHSCGKVALANMSLRNFWHLAWLLDCLQYSLQPALQSLLLLLPSFAVRQSQSTVTNVSKKQPWATMLAQDLHKLPLSISA